MNAYLGIDVGVVSVKAALLLRRSEIEAVLGNDGTRSVLRPIIASPRDDSAALITACRRTRGRPLEAVEHLLADLLAHVDPDTIAGMAVTGSGGELAAEALGVARCNEFQAAARAIDRLHPHIRTVFEIGGERSKYIRLAEAGDGGSLGIVDYSSNGDCAAGTGSFLDQQATRLKYNIEEIGTIVEAARRAAQIAGRCSVFAKSDMIHAQQKGFTPPEVLRGLCNAVAANFKTAVVRGRSIEAPVALLGGVSANSAVVRSLREAFDLDEASLCVPDGAESIPAVGAAIVALETATTGRDATPSRAFDVRECLRQLRERTGGKTYEFATQPPLTLDRVTRLRDHVRPYVFPPGDEPIDAYLGLDIGSVGTKLVVIDGRGDVIHSIFTRTEGRPVEVVSRCLLELRDAIGPRVRISAVGTTGSGRELIGELVGADSINDEITCHKTGATFVGDALLGRRPDTIFEIGGQDSKYIRLQAEGGASRDTIVVDFTMNEACAAGTGSFLEERAEELGVSIKGEFADLALRASAPIKLGERCTVFMERDVNVCMQRGAKREDVIAGLAYSIAYNYINRVVRGRPVGQCVFFQGGTAYNDAVAAAFAAVTGKEIIVPPHNAVLGAIGAAMLAQEKVSRSGVATRFRGFEIDRIDYSTREFTCKGCGNYCSVQEFTVEGEKTFWGDKCSDRYRKRAKTDRKPIVPDLVALRKELLVAEAGQDPAEPTATIGVPMAMYAHDLLPLWARFFRECGFKVIASSETNRRTVQFGLDAVVAEPCFPIIVAHGHAAELVEQKVDYLWLPNILSAETKFMDNESHVCPWGQTLPFVLRQAPPFRTWPGRILCPTIRFREGTESVRKALVQAARELGVPRDRAEAAFAAGLAALQRFRAAYKQAGADALAILRQSGEIGMVLVGRPYNLHDPGVTIGVARKLRDFYGVNVIPIDAMSVEDVDIRDVNSNMFWEYGRKILAAAKLVGEHPNLHLIYITNFKCGPDSFVKGFVEAASGKPFLTLQFDGHANDAGMMTRCEAYLDSKGVLRWWRNPRSDPAAPASSAEPSTSPRWHTPAPG